ncbi:DUF2231 domain-containing protein [Actinoplanes sp. N902-109]|uniref:DUF2231 domain-containing protein n=1 Tax=Actinoplanes sp. (strain N902-109) TaxID=649831 RepID=UPI0003294940|nr:DUF2231 domain-containing protein [Actinoplanes sp. N902-109]AGL21106.1 hypothetical protein L083_7596 [Actinoplanes sp. N902-109]
MFDQINGLPVHALVLHAAVVFVPLLALVAIVYAILPRWRSRTGWAAIFLAVVAPIATYAAMASGAKLRDRLIANGMSGPPLEKIDDHMSFGTTTFYVSLGLGIVTLVMVLLTLRKPGNRLAMPADVGLAVVMVALAAVSGYYVYKTGDSGAQAVWGTSS